MSERARHAFGNTTNLDNAIASGMIDAYDILFLDGDTDPKVGWVDKNGTVRMAKGKDHVVRVSELPVDNGDENVVYICNNEGYIWNGEQCIPISKSADITGLEDQISRIEAQIDNKISADDVRAIVDAAVEEASSAEVVEF